MVEKFCRQIPKIALIFMIFSNLWAAEASNKPASESENSIVLKKLQELDNNIRFYGYDLSCKYTTISEKPGETRKITKGYYFRRDSQLKLLILIDEPQDQKGQGYLTLNDNFWYYDPDSRKFAHSSLKDNFKGTDVKNSDFRGYLFSKDYTISNISSEKIGDYETYKIDLFGNTFDVTYPHLRIWLRKDTPVILKREDYGLPNKTMPLGRLMRTVYYPEWLLIENHYIPGKTLFIDEQIKGDKSLLIVEDPSLKPLDDLTFSKTFLEKVNR